MKNIFFSILVSLQAISALCVQVESGQNWVRYTFLGRDLETEEGAVEDEFWRSTTASEYRSETAAVISKIPIHGSADVDVSVTYATSGAVVSDDLYGIRKHQLFQINISDDSGDSMKSRSITFGPISEWSIFPYLLSNDGARTDTHIVNTNGFVEARLSTQKMDENNGFMHIKICCIGSLVSVVIKSIVAQISYLHIDDL